MTHMQVVEAKKGTKWKFVIQKKVPHSKVTTTKAKTSESREKSIDSGQRLWHYVKLENIRNLKFSNDHF